MCARLKFAQIIVILPILMCLIHILPSRRLVNHAKKRHSSEVATLRRLSSDIHPHLISLLGTYEKDRLYNLIFPWVEPDLLLYWKKKGISNLTKLSSGWMDEQCHGIASGLAYIHRLETTSGESLLHPDSFPRLEKGQEKSGNIIQGIDTTLSFCLFGLHGDVKPNNIL
ncbi:hypothetical protein GGR58DRAFT_195328 [Xylaria digitata]|nr:hypothetical protein GGR58DRAFT_195328 [Xylaria digitata]